MLIVTTESVNGGRFEQLGLVRGSSIMTVHAGKDIMNSFIPDLRFRIWAGIH